MVKLLDLPDELLLVILELIPIDSLNACSLVSKSFKEFVRDRTLWKGVFLEAKASEMAPTPRLWCSTAVLDGKMYLYGGHSCNEQSNVISEVKKDLFEYDFEKKEWNQLESTMVGLTEHKCVAFENKLWFVGGYNGHGYCNCVYKYDPETKETLLIDTTGEPFSARSALTIVIYDSKMYTFGGWNGFTKRWFNDINQFDFDTYDWKKIEPKGILPSQRTSHSAVVYKNRMYVFAGYSGERYLNDLWEFNFDTLIWTDLTGKCFGTVPEPRSRFCASVYGGKMYIVGGWNKIGYFSDFFSFDFESRIWTKIESSRFEIPSISQYSCVIYENQQKIPIMYLFGGYCAKEKHIINTLYKYRLPTYKERISNGNANGNGDENEIDADADIKEPPLKKKKRSRSVSQVTSTTM